MTKEEVIKKAWDNIGISTDNIDLSEFGWLKIKPTQYERVYDNCSILKSNKHQWSIRPKELDGLENNNGWISINDSLPKEKGYYLMHNVDKMTIIELNETTNHDTLKKQFITDGFTHYQKLETPKPPLY